MCAVRFHTTSSISRNDYNNNKMGAFSPDSVVSDSDQNQRSFRQLAGRSVCPKKSPFSAPPPKDTHRRQASFFGRSVGFGVNFCVGVGLGDVSESKQGSVGV